MLGEEQFFGLTPGADTATANAKSKFFGENPRFNSSAMQSRAE